jgi:hypothetical protein
MSPESATIERVKEQHETELMNLEGVEGVGIGEEGDRPVIKVYVSAKTKEIQQRIPRQLEGYPVLVEATGEFRTLPAGGP